MGVVDVRLCRAPGKAEVAERVVSTSKGYSLHPELEGVAPRVRVTC